MISDYVIAIGGSFVIEEASNLFLEMVRQYVGQGYVPQGGVCHSMTATPATNYHVFCQALVRFPTEEPIVLTSKKKP